MSSGLRVPQVVCRILMFVVSAFLISGASSAMLEDTVIGKLAARIIPGEFAVLESSLPVGVSQFSEMVRVKVDEGRYLETDSWTDSAHWDPKRHKTFFLGQRAFKKFISYDAATNAWSELGWAGEHPPLTRENGHTYGRTALDWKRGHYYRAAGKGKMHRYVIDQARWEEITGVPITGYISMEWHYGIDSLVAVTHGYKVYGYRNGSWTEMGVSAVHGYHSVAQFNPVRNDMLVAGGNHSLRKVDIIDANGAIQPRRDAPFDIAIKSHSLTYDPVSGNYLMLRRRERELYEYQPDLDEWRLAEKWGSSDWPFGRYGLQVPIPIEELGVILWQYGPGPMLYRHRSAFDHQRGGGR